MEQKIKVMVVDDSILFRNWLIQNLEQNPLFQIVGFAINAMDARKKIPLYKPDVMTLDIEMPGMSGLEFLKELLPENPIPVILVSSLNLRVFDALAAGAVDFVRKPDPENSLGKDTFLSMLQSKLVVASKAHVRIPGQTAAAPRTTRNTVPHTAYQPNLKLSLPASNMLIAIGASTGGTEAILAVLRQFPDTMPGVVITQHMPAGFTSMYAERLNRLCKMEVREAKHGDKIRPGLALLAPGGLQMRVVRMGSGYSVTCSTGEKVSGHCPSVDVLFDSVSLTARAQAIGILLTGMGADGAAGLLRMRKNGAYTIGQDRETCVVYGMPMEAKKIGAVSIESALGSIPNIVLDRLSSIKA